MLCRRHNELLKLWVALWIHYFMHTLHLSILTVFFAIEDVMSIWKKKRNVFLCCDKPLPSKWGGPKQTAVKMGWSEVCRSPNVAMGRVKFAALEPVWISLISQGTHSKKSTIQNRDGCGGLGQEETLLMCNQEELQTLNVEWQSQLSTLQQLSSAYKHILQV